MSEQRASLEIIAPSVEEAIAQGLSELGLAENHVDIEVLDEGSRGFLGMGTRQARVRLTLRAAISADAAPSREALFDVADRQGSRAASESLDQERQQFRGSVQPPEAPLSEPMTAPEEPAAAQEEQERIAAIARETVEELLRKMHIHAQVTAGFVPPDDERSKAPLEVDIHGEDLSILIGRRAETLYAMQLVVGMMIGKELGHAVPLVLDVEGYRKRRRRQIEQLAQRMAEQAIKTGRTQTLEPMPANERRIVHIELRKNPQVETESVGQEPRRKVTIIPKITETER